MTSWKLPVIVASIIVPIIGAFRLGGPGLGMAAGALAAGAILVVAARQRPFNPIEPPPPRDLRRHILVVVSRAVEDPETARRIAREARVDDPRADAEVLVLTPTRPGFLDRWASDLEDARHEAQRDLVITVASLATQDVAAEARVGDEDLVQAVEDQLHIFPATEVILATGPAAEDPAGAAAAEELESRLAVEFHRLVLEPRAQQE